ncbi:MAG: HAMP domain-containing histidine kinase, partial [Saprospiraceae bacterium]|nr:HAMP domain-containing histidine kinase [Saprospiraceae bacterium]
KLSDMEFLSPDGSPLSGISKLDQYFSQDSILRITQDLRRGTFGYRFTDRFSLLESMQVNKILGKRSLEERINITKLAQYLDHHLTRRDITSTYDYGVFSESQQDFVIQNGSYHVPDLDGDQFITVLDQSLLQSSYNIDLFLNSEGQALGKLYVSFPQRRSILFRNVWPTILWSILFTAIILFCFAYTIHVIFRQKKLSEMTTDFINNMTHEFKTPIATINLAADSITSPMIIESSAKVGRFASIIKQENKRMLGQVEKVLQMALLEKRDFKLKKGHFDLHQVIQQAVEHVNLDVVAKGGLVSATLEAEDPMIFADQTHITNIVRNLLDNATKYSEAAPEIHVRTRTQGDDVIIEIADKGIGMDRDQLKHIFDKFYRVHTGNRHDVKGFGLGLSYVKAMVEAHMGSIQVQSELGVGSTFSVSLPQHETHEN